MTLHCIICDIIDKGPIGVLIKEPRRNIYNPSLDVWQFGIAHGTVTSWFHAYSSTALYHRYPQDRTVNAGGGEA